MLSPRCCRLGVAASDVVASMLSSLRCCRLDVVTSLLQATSIGFTGTLWIGMNQLNDKSGDFVWADGSETSYTDWAPQEPRDGGLLNCAFTLTQPGAYTY